MRDLSRELAGRRGNPGDEGRRRLPSDPARSPGVLRQINAGVILRAIRIDGPLSAAEIARRTGLSQPTVNSVVRDMLANGYLQSASPSGPRRGLGRPGRLLRFRPAVGHVLGLDIGAEKILVAVADLAGTVIAKKRRPTPPDGAGSILRAIHEAIAAVLGEARVEERSLMAMGVGTPGVIHPGTGVISLAPQLGGWDGLRLAPALEGAVDCPVIVENEVRAALVGERARGAARGHDTIAYFQVGIGVGCGIMVEGELVRGFNGAAGEIGYLPFFPTPEGTGHQAGAFEYGAGGLAFARLGRQRAGRPNGRLLRQLAGGDPNLVDARTVFAAAERRDASALEIIEALALELAKGVAAVTLVLDPEIVILGGGVSQAGEQIRAPIARALARLIPSPPPLEVSTTGDEGVLIGSLEIAIEDATSRLGLSFLPAPTGRRAGA